jgi:catechol 2,3-dioxygenase-like lactoylglutathione lyase family enzyme
VIPVSNLEDSREFYESTLGLRGEPAPERLGAAGRRRHADFLLDGTD